jgi:hypothetical protein
MAPLALPPGPWFEAFVANDGLSYTEGFNFHYYGYASDFTPHYRTFETAVKELAAGSASTEGSQAMGHGRWTMGEGKLGAGRRAQGASVGTPRPTAYRLPLIAKKLPLFATEIGYGMLNGVDAATKEGRLRQWRWFRDVGLQLPALRMEAPMAFLPRPYFEDDAKEFGIVMKRADVPRPVGVDEGGEQGSKGNLPLIASRLPLSSHWMVGGLTFIPEDFGYREAQPWMELIGQEFGEGEITPAFAWWLKALPKDNRPSRTWDIEVPEPSPVVIDFIAGQGLAPVKRYLGNMVSGPGADADHTAGQGVVVVYNFSNTVQRGRLTLPAVVQSAAALELELAPMERREIPVTVAVQNRAFRRDVARIEFHPEPDGGPVGVFQTTFFPSPNPMKEYLVLDLLLSAWMRGGNEHRLRTRPLAVQEPIKAKQNDWLVQEGVTVEPRPNGFVVKVAADVPRPALRVEAELPWPDSLPFPEDAFLKAEVRLNGATAGASEGYYLQVRTQNGSLFGVDPMRSAKTEWSAFYEHRDNFTLWFYGRTGPQWRFRDNVPAALTVVLFPKKLPAEYEFRNVQLVRRARP